MTAKEKLLERAPTWSERDAEVALRAVEREHRGETGGTVDEWGDLSKLHEVTTGETMRRLDEEERATSGETIADAWARESSR